jgi:hypothetical protein
MRIRVDEVAIAPPLLDARKDVGLLWVSQQMDCCTIRDVKAFIDIARPCEKIVCYADKHLIGVTIDIPTESSFSHEYSTLVCKAF